SSPNNSTAMPITCSTCTDIRVEPGNRLPGIPRHSFKLRGEYTATSRFTLALDVLIQSDQFARGDENNRDVHGPVAGYTLLTADARYTLSRHWELFAKANNLLDSRYYTFALLSTNVFTGPGHSFDPTGASWRSEQFRSVGAPIGGWAGVRYRFGDGGAS
ncbi:MAG: TonB-dependent receptor, partial [Patescibacteria group bacterium]|nr:TonB-dependent receptor [Patescibacteria group bacterium]